MIFSKYVDRFFLSRQACIALGIVPSSFPYPPIDCNKSQPHSLGGISTNGSGRGQAIVRHFNGLSRYTSVVPNLNGVHIHGTNSQVWRRILPQIHRGNRQKQVTGTRGFFVPLRSSTGSVGVDCSPVPIAGRRHIHH